MTWDKNRIENTLITLNKRMSEVETEPLLSKLKMDCYVLLDILKTIDTTEYYHLSEAISLGDLNFTKFYRDFQQESMEALLKFKEIIYSLAYASDKYPYSYPKVTLKKRISEEKYLEMVREFFAMFDREHYELYEEILDGKLHFARNKQECDGVKGRCYTFLTLTDTYIITDFKRRNVVETLPHELGHGIELAMLNDIRRNMGWHYSSFVECYPRLLELIFLDYYKDSEYGDLFLLKKRELFDSLKISSEYYIDFISEMCDYDLDANKLINKAGRKVSKKQIDFIISDSLAIYLFNLYKNDFDSFISFLTEFHSYKGVSDKSIWDMITLKELKNAFYEESKLYNEEVKLSRCRRKTNTSQYF